MAAAPRGPDIISRVSIPLHATSDQPLADVPRPPESASNNTDDLAAGTAKEITPEELAIGEAARRAPVETDDGAKPEEKADAGGDPPALEFDEVPPGLPGYAVREITKHRKQAQARADAAWKAARAKVGDEAWDQALTTTRDALVEKANKEAAAAAAEAKTARDRAETIERELADLKAKAPKAEEEKPDLRPARDQFDDPDEYDTALEQWAVREGERKVAAQVAEQKAAEEKAKTDEAAEAQQKADLAAQEAREADLAKVHTEWTAKREAAIQKYPDYAEVAEADPKDGGPNVTDAMAAAILQAENGTEIAYYLGQNTEEALQIASIPNPFKQMLEMGRLSERLANPPRRTAPRAKPIEPVDTSSSPAGEPDADEDMDAYYARRNAQMQKARAPFFPAGGIH